MIIGGLQKTSLIDYPGKVCAIVFTVGCNFRCGYCHNPELLGLVENHPTIPVEDVFEFLETRKDKLDAVTITGGEPTLHQGLFDFIKRIKKMGFLVKLDSNGTNPKTLLNLFEQKLIDYVAMDIKAPLHRYEDIVSRSCPINSIEQSIALIMSSGVDYEFRTTIVKSQLSPADIEELTSQIKGARLYALQKFIPSKTCDPAFMNETSYSDSEFEEIKKLISENVQRCIVR
ncbi:MAG: Anaerobic ribonucleoside-triphosphate reductase activating protein [candidate division TM6 bacterium GW2011_GWF2_32_72]|nr:MAG: Anaerobic ribonucleoside-triphosphate reductase activating protein [candidate division TM6 bacterium GW2011_GWF2_32_72]